MTQKTPPDIVIGRLPIYLRALNALADQKQEVTSSYELGERLGISSAQIRKDLSQFGDFGKQGTGYHISYLIEQIRHILHLNRKWDVAIIGAGHVGQALANYGGFVDHGFVIRAIFDVDPRKVGQQINGITVQHQDKMGEEVRRQGIKLAMLATPASSAQEVADTLIEAGVRAILNYAPITLAVPDEVKVQSLDPVTKLQHMTYYLEP